ncbi:hypothetical protein B0A54_04969 [Friedmanniomyces endolithicus]|uniref:Uncharacterized protein n=2 Tax=Dothideomycetidae TaxID=451867 RepID=A0A4U0V747_9PEZI|nr:hypothetical protein B0A54_04969 [Friedmanniomyces endolithicus]
MTAGTYKPAASAMDKQQEEEERIQTVLAKLDDMEEPARPNLGDAIPQTPKTVKKSKVETRSNTKPGVRDSGREKRLQPKPKRDPWELQKDALEHKFGETGWQPRKRLSPDTLDGIRALHASDPGAYSTETLSDHFKIAPEAIRRILKSKWRPNEGETDDRRARWERRGVKKWQEMHELGMRPPVKWRALGVGGAEGVVEERMPKRRKVGRTDGGLSWDEVVGGATLKEERSGSSLADRLLSTALASSAMPPAATPSNIRAYVQWREPTVYSGEDIECIITFKNIGRTVEEEQGEDVQTPLASLNDSPTNTQRAQQRPLSPRPPDGWSGALSNLNPIARVMSESSTVSNTPRSSSDFYSMSNHSDETVTSEAPYHGQQNDRLLPNLAHTGRAPQSRQSSFGRPAKAETLMMGYVQTMGNFTLDGSLVNAAPFEEVKRKGVQTGGGVVGVDRSKRTSGMFGAFSWGNIGESLGGLLGGDETSSIAQMKATAGSRSIPLLSTPQSLLFVDLRLAPGESRNYSYRFALPRGLPPSHRGRALKVQYHLSITVQRPGAQNMRHVDVPFRVLGSYNARGETLGHDLMSPYILLQDTARTASIAPDPASPFGAATFSAKEPQKTVKTPKQGLEDFLRYTERLLEPSESASGALLSPTSPSSSPTTLRKHSTIDQPPASIKEAIDFAILRSNFAKPSFKQNPAEAQSPNRFNIARSGHPVAILTLLRPAYRLGEAVTGLIDFTSPLPAPSQQQPPHAPTYAVFLELESAERVDPSLALRSGSSIRRATRKSYAAVRENTLFARQVPFSLVVPATATPSFETTGISLGWRLRVEFTTQREQSGDGRVLGQGGLEGGEMLEELGTDERGTALIARERLVADTFEVAIPLKVYGAAGVEGVGSRSEALEV